VAVGAGVLTWLSGVPAPTPVISAGAAFGGAFLLILAAIRFLEGR
jgi:hypothetical protein